MKKTKAYDVILFSIGAFYIFITFFISYGPKKPQSSSDTGIQNLSVLEDPAATLQLQDVQKRDVAYKAIPGSTMFEKNRNSAYWLKFNIDPAFLGENKYLQIDTGNIENLSIFFPHNDPIYTGKKTPYNSSKIKARNWNIAVPTNITNEDYVYIRIHTSTIPSAPLRILGTTDVINKNVNEFLFFGVSFGALLAIFFVNVFSYILIKNKKFLLYIFYLASLILYHLRVHGFLYFFNFPFFAYEAILWISLAGLGIFMILFAQNYLNLKKNYPVVHIFLNVLIAFFLIQTIFGVFFSSVIANQIAYVTGFIVPIIIICVTAYCYFTGNKEVRFYLLAWCALFSATLIWSLEAYFKTNLPANYLFVSGTTVDSLLFTLAIFDSIKKELREKEILLAREQHYIELASIDPLTGLYNRRFLEGEVRQINKNPETFTQNSMIMIDLDNFREINERFGHLSGDAVLAKVGVKIRKCIRKTDLACRYGGDEFLLLLKNIDLDEAQIIAAQLKNEISNEVLYSETGEVIKITASVGISACKLEDSFEGLFLRTDRALYNAKRAGRNTIKIL